MGAKIRKKNEISVEWLLKGMYCSECTPIFTLTLSALIVDFQTVRVPIVDTQKTKPHHLT